MPQLGEPMTQERDYLGAIPPWKLFIYPIDYIDNGHVTSIHGPL
jgi:hypothetical protein